MCAGVLVPCASDTLLDLLAQCVVLDPRMRITAHSALQHAWFQEASPEEDAATAARFVSAHADTGRGTQ
ncbi:hypothetical protein EON67_07270 [archaeon]|nr:MAG: hypothetical protein EON67_07270 [archaeon]